MQMMKMRTESGFEMTRPKRPRIIKPVFRVYNTKRGSIKSEK